MSVKYLEERKFCVDCATQKKKEATNIHTQHEPAWCCCCCCGPTVKTNTFVISHQHFVFFLSSSSLKSDFRWCCYLWRHPDLRWRDICSSFVRSASEMLLLLWPCLPVLCWRRHATWEVQSKSCHVENTAVYQVDWELFSCILFGLLGGFSCVCLFVYLCVVFMFCIVFDVFLFTSCLATTGNLGKVSWIAEFLVVMMMMIGYWSTSQNTPLSLCADICAWQNFCIVFACACHMRTPALPRTPYDTFTACRLVYIFGIRIQYPDECRSESALLFVLCATTFLSNYILRIYIHSTLVVFNQLISIEFSQKFRT